MPQTPTISAEMLRDFLNEKLPEADMALPLTAAMVAVITAKLPRETAHEAIMTGQRYDAVEAQVAGIVTLTASEDDLLADAVDLATDFAEKNRGVIARHKHLLYREAMDIIGQGMT